jgi:hypothetical protein
LYFKTFDGSSVERENINEKEKKLCIAIIAYGVVGGIISTFTALMSMS